MKTISQAVSWIFHPLFIASYGAAFYLFALPSEFERPDFRQSLIILAMTVIGTALLPATTTLLLARLGKISSLKMDQQRERNWPLLLTAIIYFLCFNLFNRRGVPPFIQLMILGATASMILGLGINLKTKISLHMIGIGGWCAGLLSLALAGETIAPLVLSLSFLGAGMLGTARLYLDAHTPGQVLAGFLLGFIVTLVMMTA